MIVAIVGVAIFVISVVGGILWVRKSAAEQPRQAKILLFGVYFWLLVFAQTVVVAIVYALLSG